MQRGEGIQAPEGEVHAQRGGVYMHRGVRVYRYRGVRVYRHRYVQNNEKKCRNVLTYVCFTEGILCE